MLIIAASMGLLIGLVTTHASEDNLRLLSSAEIRYQKKIAQLDKKITTLNKYAEWEDFHNTYKLAERYEQFNEIYLFATTLNQVSSIAELTGTFISSNELLKVQHDIEVTKNIFSNDIRFFLLKDECESKIAFLNQYKKSKNTCCTIQ